MKKILYVINDDASFLSLCLPVASAAREAGYAVHIACPAGRQSENFDRHGFIHHSLYITRKGIKPWQEAKSLLAFYRLYRTLKPNLVHHFTLKPMLYGSLVERFLPEIGTVNSVTGLGYIFTEDRFSTHLLRGLVTAAFRFALKLPSHNIIFFNRDDQSSFLAKGLVARENETILLKGVGVDTQAFDDRPEPEGTPIAILASRMLKHKGVEEFVEAARLCKSRGVQARFALVGDVDEGNPTTLSRPQLEAWQREGVIEWWGFREDMANLISQSHIVCLPSYREGFPRVLAEAAASGRPIVTTDVPGCREAVVDGVNGLIVPARDHRALADALYKLIENPGLRVAMGKKGRSLALEEFSLDKIIKQTLSIYRALLKANPLEA